MNQNNSAELLGYSFHKTHSRNGPPDPPDPKSGLFLGFSQILYGNIFRLLRVTFTSCGHEALVSEPGFLHVSFLLVGNGATFSSLRQTFQGWALCRPLLGSMGPLGSLVPHGQAKNHPENSISAHLA